MACNNERNSRNGDNFVYDDYYDYNYEQDAFENRNLNRANRRNRCNRTDRNNRTDRTDRNNREGILSIRNNEPVQVVRAGAIVPLGENRIVMPNNDITVDRNNNALRFRRGSIYYVGYAISGNIPTRCNRPALTIVPVLNGVDAVRDRVSVGVSNDCNGTGTASGHLIIDARDRDMTLQFRNGTMSGNFNSADVDLLRVRPVITAHKVTEEAENNTTTTTTTTTTTGNSCRCKCKCRCSCRRNR